MASAVGSTVTLTWTAPAGTAVSAYIIEAGSSPGLANLANFSTGNALTTFQASGIGAGTYYVRIRAATASGAGDVSNEATLIVVGPTSCISPGAPTGFTNTVNAGGVVGFSWNASTGSPTSYVIEAGSSSGLANLANSDLGTAATTMTATGVGNGTYYVRLRAKNACGVSPPSAEIVVAVGAVAPFIFNIAPTAAVPGTFTLAINGADFDPATALIAVTGPGCPATPTAAACQIPNGQLMIKTIERLEASVALQSVGTFTIYVINGSSGIVSNGVTLTTSTVSYLLTLNLSTGSKGPFRIKDGGTGFICASLPSGLNSCTMSYPAGARVTLANAYDALGDNAIGYSGCDSFSMTTCSLVMNSARTVNVGGF